MYCTYILYSKKLDKFYISSTENLPNRILQHNSGQVSFTSRGIPWELKYSEEFSDRTTAMRREYEIKKKKSRKYIQWLISGKV